MSLHDAPSKPRRKKLEVPIHQTEDLQIRKTFSANFNSKQNKHKPPEKSPKGKKRDQIEAQDFDTISRKVSRRHLMNENQKLSKDNEDLLLKFNELEDLSVKKITKLREKVSSIQNINEQVSNENDLLNRQSLELQAMINDLKLHLEASKYCKSCQEFQTSLQKINDENKHLKTVRNELEEDLNMLKTVVYRLNQQMERYQEKMSKTMKLSQLAPQSQSLDNVTIIDNPTVFLSADHKNRSHTPISWGKVNIHTLGPLLDAYQDSIFEKEEIINNYESELSNFTSKLKEVIKENEQLHKHLTDDEECSAKLKIELETIKVEMKSLRDQNDILIKKCAMKQDKVEEVIKIYEVKVEQLKRDYSVAHEQYCKGRAEIAGLREKAKALNDAQEDFKNERQNYIPLSVHNSSVNECKKWYEQLKSQYEQEKSKLQQSVDSQIKLIDQLNKEKEELDGKVKQLDKQMKKGESKFLELEHSLSESQFTKSACRKQLHKAMSFAKDLVSEQETLLKALNQKQQENKAVKRIGSDIATRMDFLRNQLKDVQRGAWQELSTVEKRIQKQHNAMETMKQEHNDEIERLQQIIKEREKSNLLLNEETALPVPHYLLYRDKHNS